MGNHILLFISIEKNIYFIPQRWNMCPHLSNHQKIIWCIDLSFDILIYWSKFWSGDTTIDFLIEHLISWNTWSISWFRRFTCSNNLNFLRPLLRCGHQATTKGNLINHQSTVHESFKYPCRKCDHQAILNGHLVQQKKASHEGVKDFCRQWDYQVITKGNLIQI